MRKSSLIIGAIAAMAVWSGTLTADDKDKPHGSDKGHVMVRADDIK